MRRPPRFITFDPQRLRAALTELAVAPDCAGDAVIRRALGGRPLNRIEQARLRKRLTAAILPDRVDHRSGAYARAKARVRAALARAAHSG